MTSSVISQNSDTAPAEDLHPVDGLLLPLYPKVPLSHILALTLTFLSLRHTVFHSGPNHDSGFQSTPSSPFMVIVNTKMPFSIKYSLFFRFCFLPV